MNYRVLSLLLMGVAILAAPDVKADSPVRPPLALPRIFRSVPQPQILPRLGWYWLPALSSSSQDLAITANYLIDMSYCYGAPGDSSTSSVFLSTDRGSLWSGGCQPPSGPDVGPQYDPIAAYDEFGNLFSGQLGSSGTAETVFLQELPAGSILWGDFFPTLTYTDLTTTDFFDFDFPGMAIDNNLPDPCIYMTAWELGRSLGTKFKTVSAIVVGHSCDGGSTWISQRVSKVIVAPNFAMYPRVTVSPTHTVTATWVEFGDGNYARFTVIFHRFRQHLVDANRCIKPPHDAGIQLQEQSSGLQSAAPHLRTDVLLSATCQHVLHVNRHHADGSCFSEL